MSVEETKHGSQEPAERTAIGIAFGNSNSSIGHTSGVRIPCFCLIIATKRLLTSDICLRKEKRR
jgi:hypothetical protein